MTFKYTNLGPGDLGIVPDYDDDSCSQVDLDNDDLTRMTKVWNYLIDHSPGIDRAILEMLDGRTITQVAWAPILNELADAVNYVLTQETSSSAGDISITD